MKVYNCNPITKEYIGTSEAFLDIMASKREGKEVYALPAHASFEAPPDLIEGHWRRLIDGKWVLEPLPEVPEPVIEPTPVPVDPTPEELKAQEIEALIQAHPASLST